MTVTVKVDGQAELEKALFALGSTSTARRVGQRALMVAAEPMVEAIQRFAPKDKMNLDRSIKAQPSNRDRNRDTASVVIGIDGSVNPTVTMARQSNGKRKGPVIDLGVAGYSVMQEFGTPKMAANPFMRPGFDATAALVITRVGATLGSEIEKSAARLAKKQARGG